MTQQANREASIPSSDPFDLSRLRLGQNFSAQCGIKKILRTVPVRKPGKQDFFRVHPDPEWRLETAVLELKEERETYLVSPDLWPLIPNEISPKLILTTLNRQGVLALWPVRLPGEDGKLDNWSRSALSAAQEAETKWTRLASNMSLGAYEVYTAGGDIPPPKWPDTPFQEILKIAFQNAYIDNMEHPVVRRLLGA